MGTIFTGAAKILTFLGVLVLVTPVVSETSRAEDVTSCSVEPSLDPAYDWFTFLTGMLDEGTKTASPPVVEKQPDRPVPSQDEPDPEPELEDVATERFDLPMPYLSKLRETTRKAARRCRERNGKTICGTTRSKFLCFRAVKEALLGAGLVSSYLPGVAAKYAHTHGIFAAEGMRDIQSLGYTAATAPLGSVLVYDGGEKLCGPKNARESCGHVEIKLNENEFCSDHCRATPIQRYKTRKLLGIYVLSI